MTLNELFTSYNQVFPVTFQSEDNNIYSNLNRARNTSNSYKNWKVGQHSSDSNYLHWKVNPEPKKSKSEIKTKTPKTKTPKTETPKTTNSIYSIAHNGEKYIDLSKVNMDDYIHLDVIQEQISQLDMNKAKLWINRFENLGFTKEQSIALAAMVFEESRFNPKKYNKDEFNGKSKNVTPGWAGCGEGCTQITHWSTKEKLIKKLNNDRRRTGPELPETKEEYSKNNSIHIVDLNEDDAALITALYYENALKQTKNTNFKDTICKFYLEKAGAGGSAVYYNDLMDKALVRGLDYAKHHESMGYENSGSRNKFIEGLRIAEYILKNYE